jgi:serine protease inhibitor
MQYYGNHFRRMGPRVGALLAAGMLGKWSSAFGGAPPVSPAATPGLIPTDAPMQMVQRSGTYRYWHGRFESTPFQAALLPFPDDKLSMLIVLPDAGHDLRSFVASITTERLRSWKGQLRPSAGTIALPSFVRVHGNWLGAAIDSLTVPANMPLLATGHPFDMVIDRPFFYAIWDEGAREFLFIGVLTDPNYSASVAISRDGER